MAIQAFSTKQKKKVDIIDPKINRTRVNGNYKYRAHGLDDQGNKVTTFLNEATATAALENGEATKGSWE